MVSKLTGHEWDRPHRQVESLPGQRLLFEPVDEHRDRPSILPRDSRYLFDAGHGPPGAGETAQKILWDVE